MESAYKVSASVDDLKTKNQIYNDADSAIWRKTVYDPVHGGWAFTNIGGREILNTIAKEGKLDETKRALELCCGLGATCHYLASKFDCKVTGIDINSHQINHARNEYSNESNPIEFILDDIVCWQPREFYDTVFVMDSLTLIERPELILEKSAKHLTPGGLFAFSEVTAGANITDRTRQLCWEEDGFINLISDDEYAELLANSGLSSIEVIDRTDLAYECFSKILQSVIDNKQTFIEMGGEMLYESWLKLNMFYVECFEKNHLNYTFATAWQD